MSTVLDFGITTGSSSGGSDGKQRELKAVRVLCAQRDVIGKIGGGEAAAARLFGRAKDAQVTWPVSQPPASPLGPNFEPLLLDETFRTAIRAQLRVLPREFSANDSEDFLEAASIAHAARGREFDIVEFPDYVTYGRFLPFALAEWGVKYKRLVCSLHGRLTRTFEIENQFQEVIAEGPLENLRRSERQAMFGAADIRYGFSERYVNQTRALAAVPVALVDPLAALPNVEALSANPQAEPKIWFVARQDRFKGADLFLAAIFRAGEEYWNRYAMCGPSVRLRNRVSVFEGMDFCRNRGMQFNYRGPLPYSEIVQQVYRSQGFVVVPSREETFNLVSLEALLHGTPVLISKHAGAADFIRNRFGEGFGGAMEFDPLDELASASAVRSLWENLHEHRRAVRSALESVDLTARPESLIEAYQSEAGHDPVLRAEAFRVWNRLLAGLFVRNPYDGERSNVSTDMLQYVAVDSSQSSEASRNSVGTATISTEGPGALFHLADAILSQPASENRFVALHQTRRLAALSPHINRAKIYRQLAACEEPLRPFVAAAYRLRAFRMGALSGSETACLTEELQRLGAANEAQCLRLWSMNGDSAVQDYLEDRRQKLLAVDLEPEEYAFDHRHRDEPKVSILVSMYDVPVAVLQHFLAHLSRVAMVRRREAEIVFIDSGSPSPQLDLLQALPALDGLSWVLIRSTKRETIQTAWNRGIRASRGEYITCLGVDEGITETALDDLSRFLDENREVDWVTANTVVTRVDDEGRWKRDVMSYSRPQYSRFNYFNDCTYINYVGGLYRKAIHRFGMYDGTFRGAGDTEFKCRIFPFIRTAALPKTLGFYFDFPAERVTNSANIEVEDLRAWYVFRTPGGIEYLMADKDADAWEELFWTALSGKRCWAKVSADCDLSFAENVLARLLRHNPSSPLKALAGSLSSLTHEMRLLQQWSGRAAWLGVIAEKDLLGLSAKFFAKCALLRPDLTFPQDFRADAFFFAHSWTWQ